jgi:hypothetical protein
MFNRPFRDLGCGVAFLRKLLNPGAPNADQREFGGDKKAVCQYQKQDSNDS